MTAKKKILIALLFNSIVVNAQQPAETYSYSNWSYTSPTCSFGSSGTTVNGRVHKTILGQPTKLGGTEQAVVLESRDVVSGTTHTYKADQFAITFPFKYGYKYKIEITASQDAIPSGQAQIYPAIFAQMTNDTYTANNCNGPEAYTDSRTGYTKEIVGSTTYAVKIWDNILPSQNFSRLEVGAVARTNQELRYIYVREVKITILDYASFTINLPQLNLSCGTTTPQTLTVSNPYSVSDISNYSWSLPANNGWLYNGSAAPSTPFTTVTNSITLTPVCGVAQSDISVTITFDADHNFTRTYIFDVTVGAPNIYIYPGPDVICTTGTYTLVNVPCGNTVTWSGMNSNVTPSTPTTGNPITLTKVNNTYFTLTASVSACGTTYNVSKDVTVGPVTSIASIDFVDYLIIHCHVSGYKFSVNTPPHTNHLWEYDDGTGYQSFGGSGNQVTFFGDGSCNPATIRVTAYNTCNSTPYPDQTTVTDMCTPYDDPNCRSASPATTLSNVEMFPNPSKVSLTLSLKDVVKTKAPAAKRSPMQKVSPASPKRSNGYITELSEIKSVVIYNHSGVPVFTQKFSGNKRSVKLNIWALPVDVYLVMVSDGTNTATLRLSKQ